MAEDKNKRQAAIDAVKAANEAKNKPKNNTIYSPPPPKKKTPPPLAPTSTKLTPYTFYSPPPPKKKTPPVKPPATPDKPAKDNFEEDDAAGYAAGLLDFKSTGSGSGSGSGRNPLNDYTQQLQKLITGGSYADPYNDLLSKFQGLFDTQKTALAGLNTEAGKTIDTSMNSLETMLKGQANPYANLQAENVTPTAQLSSFLQGQNVDDQQTQDYAQVLNAQNAGAATNFNNLAGVLRSMATANQTGALADVATQRDASKRQLATTNAGIGSALQQSFMGDQRDIQKSIGTERNSLMQQLMDAIAKGGVPKKGRLF